MARRKVVDWAVICVLGAVWVVLCARAIDDGLRTQRGYIQLRFSSAVRGNYPTIVQYPNLGFEIGDRIEALDGEDLRGATALHVYDRLTRLARANGSVEVRATRDRVPFTLRIGLTPRPLWWVAFPVLAFGLLVGVTLLLRAPKWPLARLTFVALWAWDAAHFSLDWLEGPRGTVLELSMCVALLIPGTVLLVWILQGFTASARPVPRWQRMLALGVGVAIGVNLVGRALVPMRLDGNLAAMIVLPNAFILLTMLGALARSYRLSNALERRQIRWVVLGYAVATVGVLISGILPPLLGQPLFLRTPSRILAGVAGAGVPAGILISVIGYRWLDIDRLISAAASYALVGITGLGAALALIPRVTSAAAPALGIDPAFAQWLLTMTLVGAAVPAALYLRPRLDRQIFAERHRRTSGLDQLLDEVRRCSGADELWELASARLHALLDPVSLVVYAREGDAFGVRFARGPSEPKRYAADSLLVHALERRGRPLAADSRELDPFDRAALETLGVALIIPIGTREALLGFACLGSKRSGDIYTREETAQLAAIASRCAEVLQPAVEPPPEPAIFRRDGDLWTLASSGKEVRLRDMRGLHYLAMLLREPRREFAPLEMVRSASGLAPTRAEPRDPELHVTSRLGDASPTLDAQARAEYRSRVTALEAELADAERCSDLGRIERASAEREVLLAELESSARGRGAPSGSDSERARIAVTKAIKFALDRIADAHPELGAHLAATIRRGYVCAYVPDPRVSADWQV